MRKFAESLDDAVKKDYKLIETEFKKFCKTSKNKENRFVSNYTYVHTIYVLIKYIVKY